MGQPFDLLPKNNTFWWSVLGSNQSCPKAPDLQSSASPLMLPLHCMVSLPRFELGPPGPKPGTLPDYATESYLEEDVRFELTDRFRPLVFKTSAIDHSANPPCYLVPRVRFELTTRFFLLPFERSDSTNSSTGVQLVRLARIELAPLTGTNFKSVAATCYATVVLH